MKRITSILLGGVVAVAIGLAAGAAAAQSKLPQGVSALLDKAAKEGVVSIFVSTDARTAEDEVKLEAGIQADLGIKIDVRLVSGAPDPVYIQQLVQQHAAGVTPPVDLIVTVPTLLARLSEVGAIAATDWASMGANPDEVADEVHGLFVAEFARPVIYNTKLISAADAPSSIEQLLDPKWKGKIVTSSLPDVFSPWAIGLGEDGVLKFVKALFVDSKVGIAPRPTSIRTQVESGEYPIGFGIRMSREQIESKAPVAYAPIKAPLVPRYAGVFARSEHKDAAAAVAWWLSATANGQHLAATVLDWPRHTTPGTDLYEMAKITHGLYSAPAKWWMHEGNDIGAKIAKLLNDL